MLSVSVGECTIARNMDKEEIFDYLESHKIYYERADHKAVFNMAEMREVHLPHPEAEAKNLFVRDDRKRSYYMITVSGDKRVDLKKFQAENGTRRLSFASDSDLMIFLGLIPGAVTPLGLLNDNERKIEFYLDRDFWGEGKLIGIHPNDNTATVWLSPEDLVRMIREHGNTVHIVPMD